MSSTLGRRSPGISRRKFLGALCTGAVAPGVLGAERDIRTQPFHQEQFHQQPFQQRRFVLGEDSFGRLFPELPPFAEASPQLESALLELGRPGGILDAKDDLTQGPILLITSSKLSENNNDNPMQTAGVTFMAQFMDHDMTFDLQSRLGVPTNPEDSPNERTPNFDLDTVYGGGPARSPDLYDHGERGDHRQRGIKLRIESGGLFEDLPRARDSSAIIGDPRNDENLMIAGLHAAFLLFHNNAVDLVAKRNPRAEAEELYREARKLCTWHYHWIILHEILPLFVGQALVDEILSGGRKYYRPQAAYIPVEFQGAAYRFGHSMVRPSYRANLAGDNGAPFFGFIFDPAGEGDPDPVDLRGGVRAPRRFVGWQTFFDFGDGQFRPNKRIDARLSTPLFNLPRAAIPAPDGPTSLPQRNLLRSVTWGLPSGQAIAKHMNVPSLTSTDLADLKQFGQNLASSTPLFYYVLKEAEIIGGGVQLGPVGSRIVAEVLLGLLQLDQGCYLASQPEWRPTLPNRYDKVTGDYRMTDFLTFAGVSPAQRGQ
jgi:Animal haem peroxidase